MKGGTYYIYIHRKKMIHVCVYYYIYMCVMWFMYTQRMIYIHIYVYITLCVYVCVYIWKTSKTEKIQKSSE